MHILIIGAGLGGLVCAIACRRAGLQVTVLEQSAVLSEIGAGIQIPPNAVRIMKSFGLLPAIKSKACRVEWLDIRRYKDGKVIFHRPLTDEIVVDYGGEWLAIHRADYHKILAEEAQRLGAEIVLKSRVTNVDIGETKATVEDGRSYAATVIIGADGLWSTTRESLLDTPSPPYETGDLAYRATIPRDVLLAIDDPRIQEICLSEIPTLWVGPDRHCVFYPVKGGMVFNLVLIRPDNMPRGSRTLEGDLGEMRESFQGWDPVLTTIISCVPSVLKWKLLHHEELRQWVKNCTALLGDACHPSLPYQGQGAAMAVEDGALLGMLFGEFNQQVDPAVEAGDPRLVSLLKLYEDMRKPRTSLSVQGALDYRCFFHTEDGPEQEERDSLGTDYDWKTGSSKYFWLDTQYQKELLGYDALAHGQNAFQSWLDANSRTMEAARDPRL